jgi:hypothetical protein
MRKITTSGNTVVPAILTLESLGFTVSVEREGPREIVRATRGDETYLADDPVAVLGLVKLVEARGWDWKAADSEIDDVLRRYELG